MFKFIRHTKNFPNVLIFHKISNINVDILEGVEKSLSLDSNTFKNFLEKLTSKYEPIKLLDFTKNFKSKIDYSQYFIITFDDGYQDNIDVAYPILEKLKIPFTIFLTTDLISQKDVPIEFILSELILKNSMRFDSIIDYNSIVDNEIYYRSIRNHLKKDGLYLMKILNQNELDMVDVVRKEQISKRMFLNWDLVKHFKNDDLVNFGAHSKNHCSLKSLSKKNAISQIDESIFEMETKLGKQVNLFSYPYGEFNLEHVNYLRKKKFVLGAVSTNNNEKQSLFNIKRKEWFEFYPKDDEKNNK